MSQIDSLSIQITADAQKAVSSLNRLSQSLQTISNSLAMVNGTGFSGLTNGINQLTTAMSNYANSGIKTADFTRLATQLNRVAQTDTSGLVNLSNAINRLVVSTDRVSTLGAKTSQITEFAKSLSKLGGTNIGKAVTNIPLLANAMRDLLTTLSQSPNVSKNVTKLTRALADLTKNMRGVRTASSGSAKGLNSFSVSAQKTTSASKGLASAIGKVYATYWLLFRAFSVFGKAVNYASSLTEIQNVVEQTFGQSTQKVNEFAVASKEMLGMSELTAKEIASRYQAMGQAMDISNKSIAKTNEYLTKITKGYNDADSKASAMSLTLTKLAGDMASFYDNDQKDVAEDLEAIYTGMTRPLRKYGLDLTQATLEEYANKRGIDAKVSSMSQAEKTMLRYQYVLENTTNAQGDFLRTADTWANQVKIMKQNFISLGTTVGQVFINAFKPFIRTLNNILVAVNNFATKVANALGNIFGWVYEGNDVGLLSETEDEAGGLADNLGKADKNAKKLKNTIMGYDELNVMQEPKDKDSDSGSSVDDAISGGLNSKDSSSGHWVKKYESEIDNLFDLGRKIADTLQEMMEGIDWDSIYEKARNFGKGLAEFLNGLFKPEMFYQIGRTIAGCLNTVLNGLEAFADEFDFTQLGEAIGSAINGFFENFDFHLAGRTLNKWVQGIFDTIKTAVQTVKWEKIWEGIEDFVSELEPSTIALIVGAWLTPKVLKLFADKITGKLLSSLTSTKISKLKTDLISKLETGLGGGSGSSILNGAGVLLFTIEVSLVTKKLAEDVTEYKKALGITEDSLFLSFFDRSDEMNQKRQEYAKTKGERPNERAMNSPIADYFKNLNNFEMPKIEFTDGLKEWTQQMNEASVEMDNLIYGVDNLNSNIKTVDITTKETKLSTEDWNKQMNNSADSIELLTGNVATLNNDVSSSQGTFQDWKKSVKTTFDDLGTNISSWYTDKVAPYLSKEKWSTEWNNVKSTFQTQWNGIVSWWESSALYKWFNEDVKPWFTIEKWTTLWNNIKSVFQTKWNEISTWWQNTGVYKWYNEHVKPWFNKEKWETLWNNVKSTFQTKWNEIVAWWENSALVKWYNDKVKPWFSKEKWSFSGIKEGLEQAFNNAIEGIKNIWNNFANWMNDKLNFSWDGFQIGDRQVLGGHINLGKLPTFATGGFPEDGLFMANHNELVGEFSNGKTAVANNQQITDGIKQAVIEGMMNVVMATSSNSQESGDINLYLDGRVIAQTTYNNLKTMSRQGVIPRFI